MGLVLLSHVYAGRGLQKLHIIGPGYRCSSNYYFGCCLILLQLLQIMSFCVPHWDSRGVTPEDGMPSNEYLELEGKGDITRYKRNQLSQFATV